MSFPAPTQRVRIGIAGTGFIGTALARLLHSMPQYEVSKVLTARPKHTLRAFDTEILTSSAQEVVDQSDLVIECSGKIHEAFDLAGKAIAAGKQVITMSAEFQVTLGSHFAASGLITEAEGDQPGSLAALHEEAVSMGFRPLVYGNIKGFLNHNPPPEEMAYWSEKNGISLGKVTSFTDGTKLQYEQALVANGMGADIIQPGLLGLAAGSLESAAPILAGHAVVRGRPVSDYVLNPTLPAGVFITAEHPVEDPSVLRYFKLGNGPYYTLLRPYHLCHLEVPRTIHRMLTTGRPLLTNSETPTIGIGAIARTDLVAGTVIEKAVGGKFLRGEAIRIAEAPDAAPMGLLDGAVIKRSVSRGAVLTLDDVDIPATPALSAWVAIRDRAIVSRPHTNSPIGRKKRGIFPAIQAAAAII